MDNFTVIDTGDGEGTDLTSDSDKCHICLSLFEKQALGSLESCQHVFCLECILQWSKTANTCPVDRISFVCINQRRCPGGDIQKKIKVRTQKNDDDEEEEEGSNAVICERCGRSDRRHRLIVCTQCDSGYHMDCLTPALTPGPEGQWICPDCAVCPQHTDGSIIEEEISDGELIDLLAEVDGAASTSSRLRPSTTSRPSSSAVQRRSQRIQSRASTDHSPRPQTCWHVPKYLLRASQSAVTTEEEAALPHSDASDASVQLKTRKRRKRAA